MSFPTQPAFVVFAKGWDTNLLAHPMLNAMYEHEKLFDAKQYDAIDEFYDLTKFKYVKSTGEEFHGRAGLQQSIIDYGLFAEYFHEPVYGTVTAITDDNYRLFGQAKMFVNLPGSADIDKKYEDLQGRKWECLAQGSFIFEAEKVEGSKYGFRFHLMQVFADPTPILSQAIKRGIVSPETLLA